MENTSRHVFSIHGVTGMLIATVLLLLILGTLTYLGLMAQKSVANEPYKINNPEQIKMIDKENAKLKSVSKGA